MEKENRNKLIQIIVSAVLLAAAYIVGHFVSLPLWAQLLTYLPAYAVVGYEVIIEAFEGITEGEVFGEEFLMTIATVGARVSHDVKPPQIIDGTIARMTAPITTQGV